MTDLGHGKDIKIVKKIDSSAKLDYSSHPTFSADTEIVDKKYVDDAAAIVAKQEVLTVSAPGQTAFTLSQTPSGADSFGLFLNGQLRENPTDYTFTGTALTWNDPGGLTLQTTDLLLAWYDFTAVSGTDLDQTNMVFVSKAGNDGNDGLNIDKPVLTLNRAMTVVGSLGPTSTNRFKVFILDGGIYDEPTLEVTLYTALIGLAATVKSELTLRFQSRTEIFKLEQPTGATTGSTLITTYANTSASAYISYTMDCGDYLGIDQANPAEELDIRVGRAIINDGTLIARGNALTFHADVIEVNGAGGSVYSSTQAGSTQISFKKLIDSGSANSLFVTSTAAQSLYVTGDLIIAGDSDIIFDLSDSATANVNVKNIDASASGAAVYELYNSSTISIDSNKFVEATASSVDGTSSASRITNGPDGDILLRSEGILIDASLVTKDLTLSGADVVITNGGTDAIIATNGFIEMPSTPFFSAWLNTTASNVTGDGTGYQIIYDIEEFDVASNYNPATGVFTAPVTGKYRFTGQVALAGLQVGHNSCRIRLNGSVTSYDLLRINPSSIADAGILVLPFVTTVALGSAETITILAIVSGSTKVVSISIIDTKFSGNLIST